MNIPLKDSLPQMILMSGVALELELIPFFSYGFFHQIFPEHLKNTVLKATQIPLQGTHPLLNEVVMYINNYRIIVHILGLNNVCIRCYWRYLDKTEEDQGQLSEEIRL